MFKDRIDAGQKLAVALKEYHGKDAVIFALTRGGVPVGKEVAKALNLPFEPLIIRKIGHPGNKEYAVGAISSGGQIAINELEIASIDKKWFQDEARKQKQEADRRVKIFLESRKQISIVNKIAIIIDDGIATGLTMQAAIKEIESQKPNKIIVASPIAPSDTINEIRKRVDDCVVLLIPEYFAGAVGAYYEDFHEVTDDDVIKILNNHEK